MHFAHTRQIEIKMTIPISLNGMNLGERHRHINSLVVSAYNDGISFETISGLPENTPVDRLFKIDLASKHKHVDYILSSLQDDDMLYVSRALKSKWLLDDEHRHIVNPAHLEDVVYPQMITTAVNKMKHWIHLHLRDPARCVQFYKYYSGKDDDYAWKFLCKCTEEIVLREFPKKEVLAKITPQRLKLLCEKSSSVAKLFFESLSKDKSLLEKYISHEYKYFNSLKCLLKTEADTFLNITEKHFMPHFKRLSPISTKYIVNHQKDRFMLKPELYTARILNVDTIAKCLNPKECEELVLKLARAKYLSDEYWFNYKNVEPLIKRLPVEKRASFKKKVFVAKDVGDIVQNWPYTLPESPRNLQPKVEIDVFLDKDELRPTAYGCLMQASSRQLMACSGAMPMALAEPCQMRMATFPKPKTLLDVLFDEYRFKTFNETLFDLRKKIKAVSESQSRMYMMLVLVSKSGGKEENLDALFQVLMEHRNEPCQVRAAIIRSLVKRACVWRVSEDIWNKLLIFGQGLGLDGGTPEADCDEGLHAVVIRSLLQNRDCGPAIKNAFIKKFSKLTDYSLKFSEKQEIKMPLLNMLLESSETETDAYVAAQTLWYAIDIIQANNLKFEAHHKLLDTIKKLVEKDQNAANGVLKRLFDSKLGRKELFKENFGLIQTDASYINALKHDITILSVETFIKSNKWMNMKMEQFFRKLNVYFNGNEDLASHFLTAIKMEKIHKKYARPLAYLMGNDLKSYILELDTKDDEFKRFSASVRANTHVARPNFGIDSLGWHKSGAKLIANRVIKCKAVDIDNVIKQLLTWKRTARLAIVLAQRTNYEADIFEAVAKIRPTVALKTALTYFRRRGDQSDVRVWQIVKPLLTKIKPSNKRNYHFLRSIMEVESIPLNIRPEYATEVFKVISEVYFNESLSVLHHIMLLLPKIDENFVESILNNYVQKEKTLEKKRDRYYFDRIANLHLKIFVRYLLLCKTEEAQNRRFEKVGKVYLDHLRSLWESDETKKKFRQWLDVVIPAFKYCEVFLSDEYVSCLPVMEKFVQWMRSVLPMEKYFGSYVPLHLTMLYYKAIRQIAKQVPEMIADKQMRCTEGYKLFGEVFGKYVGHEAHVLTEKYFDSINELYSVGLVGYMNYFNDDKFRLIPYIIKGIIEVSDGIECILALDLFQNNYHSVTDDEKQEIRKILSKNKGIEMQFLSTNEPPEYRPWIYANRQW